MTTLSDEVSLNSALRKLLDACLVTVPDLDAFCIDRFPSIHRQFASGMTRTERLNLLLVKADTSDLLAYLHADFGEICSQFRHLLPPQEKPMAKKTPQAPTVAPARRANAQSPRERPSLTVLLQRDAQGVLQVQYAFPDGERSLSAPPQVFSLTLAALELAGLRGAAALERLLRVVASDELPARLENAGDWLFSLLFPDEKQAAQLFARLYGTPHATASRDRLRLRILSQDPELLALPWELCTDRGQPLFGWTYERVAQEQVQTRATLNAPARILCIAPTDSGLPAVAEHVADLQQILGTSDPAFFQHVQTRRQLEAALSSFPADVVYFYGRGVAAERSSSLVLAERKQLSLDDLARAFSSHRPQLLILNGGPEAMDPRWLAAPAKLLSAIPAIVIGRGGPYAASAAALGGQYLRLLLRQQLEPAAAILQDDSLPPLTQTLTRAAFLTYTAYDSFEVRPQLRQSRHPKSHLRLDRTAPRAMAYAQVKQLVQSPTRRVEALMAHADAENLLGQFSWQAIDFIEKQALTVPLQSIAVGFPSERNALGSQLESHLRTVLEAKPRESLSQLLSRVAPKVRGQASARILWLDFGVCGGSEGRAPLKPRELEDWLHFCFDALVKGCPPDLRIVAYLGIHVEERNHNRLKEDIEKLKLRLMSDAFRAFLLPALPSVEHSELVEFLTDPGNTTCPPSLAREVAGLIFFDTHGVYEKIIRHIEWAEQHGWALLRANLLRAQRPATALPQDDETY